MPWIFLTIIFPPSIKCRFEDELMLTNLVPTYIRATTNRINAQYSVVKVKENKVIEKVMELASSAAQDLAIGEKILIFCSSVDEVKWIGESIDYKTEEFNGFPEMRLTD